MSESPSVEVRPTVPDRPPQSGGTVARSGLVGIDLARASLQVKVTVLALAVARRVHNSTMAAFHEAPL